MTTLDLALLILRLVAGLTFAAHGAQKAFGWWQGPGPVRWIKVIHGMGFHPPTFFAAASILAELGGGLMLAIGFVTPLVAAILVAQSVVIVVKAHWPKGFFSTHGGIEFPLVLGTVALCIALVGAGGVSVDALLGLGFDARVRLGLALAGLLAGCFALAVPRLLESSIRRPLGRAQ